MAINVFRQSFLTIIKQHRKEILMPLEIHPDADTATVEAASAYQSASEENSSLVRDWDAAHSQGMNGLNRADRDFHANAAQSYGEQAQRIADLKPRNSVDVERETWKRRCSNACGLSKSLDE